MKTEQECYALLGKHVQTPKGEGVVRNFSVRFGENGIAAFYVFNVELDSGDDPGVGTWVGEGEVEQLPSAQPPSAQPPARPRLDSFALTLKELTAIAFVAGYLCDFGDADSGGNMLSHNLSEIVDRIVAERAS